MLDAFGFDPGYPGLMAAAGLAESSWARGPYHQWGPQRTVGDNTRMQMRSEFEWVSPDGQGLLTSYMPNHYGAGWGTHRAASLAAAEQEALGQFRELAPVAATRNVLLPVGADHVIPSRWVTGIHRDWNARYVWPRFVTALPREFFAAVREDAAARGRWLVPQTRDMNPVYPGKDVSYIDTKQGQRAAEIAVGEAERLATLAWLAGARYPAESLDKAWRQLVFGAHHDAITGTESDQVYLDLLGGWREAWQRGDEARRDAAAYLAGLADTRPPDTGAGHPPGAGQPGTGQAVTVFNTLSWARSGLARTDLEFTAPGPGWITLRDDSGGAAPFLAEAARRHPDGTLAAVTLTFRAADVPALGYRTWWASPAPGTGPGPEGWEPQPGTVIENEAFLVEADPARGGTLTRIVDKRTGAGLLRRGGETGPAGGNELLLQEEYDAHPRWGEGPWLLSPKGPGTGSGAASAKVTAQRCPLGARLVAELTLGDLRVTQETLLWDGAERIEFRTHVDGSIGQDRLLRVRFPADVPGGLPIYQGATAVVGRSFGSAVADVAEYPFTLDSPAHEWFGLGSTARAGWREPGGARQEQALGVAEVILPASPSAPGPAFFRNGLPAALRDLVAALAGQGVTATCSQPDGPRYGSIDLDSNLPDVRIVLGGPEQNPWTARVLEAAGPGAAGELSRLLAAGGSARLWIPAAQSRAAAFAPGADVTGLRDLPVLIVAGPDLAAAAASVTADLADSVIEVTALAGAGPAPDERDPALAPRSVALLNRGTPSSLVSPDGTLHIALMRSCSAWPSGVWIDGDKRAAPDGSSFAWQHWSHTFEYALAAGPGDWREAGFGVAGQDYNHDLLACGTGLHPGPHPAAASLCAADLPVMVSALKPRGNPLAAGRAGLPRRADGVTARLRDLGGRAGRGPAEPVHRDQRGASHQPGRGRRAQGYRDCGHRDCGQHRRGQPGRGQRHRRDVAAGAGRAGRDHGACRRHRHAGPVRAGAARTPPVSLRGGPGTRPAGLHPLLAARQGTGPGGQPPGRGASVTGPGRAAPGGRGPGRGRGPPDRGLRAGARLGSGGPGCPGRAGGHPGWPAALRPARPRSRALGPGRARRAGRAPGPVLPRRPDPRPAGPGPGGRHGGDAGRAARSRGWPASGRPAPGRPAPRRPAGCAGCGPAGHRGRARGQRAHAGRPDPARGRRGTGGPGGQPGRVPGPG